jgi:hypothetical protein
MATFSATELNEQAELAYIRGTYYIALLNSEIGYTSSTVYVDILADEVTAGVGGYARLSYTYSAGDLLAYSSGQPLSRKVANFVHDGSSEQIVFTHVALLREVSGTYTIVGIDAVGEEVVLDNGQTAVINIDILHGVP